MKAFAALFAALDGTTRTSVKTAALADYFSTAPEADRVWTIALLSGRRPKRLANSTELRVWTAEAAGIPLWLFEESYSVAGDLAETIARLLPPARPAIYPSAESPSLDETIRGLIALTGRPEADRKAHVLQSWSQLDGEERFLFNKLLTGGFRMGVSQGLMVRALAQATGHDDATLAHRLMGKWNPAQTSFAALIQGDGQDGARPYPFALAAPLDAQPATLGPLHDWLAEWKWDGIRGQLILREGAYALWSRGEQLITDRFPEFASLADFLPKGSVIDGEIVAWDGTAPMAFADLQKRIGRKTVPRRLLTEAPAHFLAYDLLEYHGMDQRTRPFGQRRDLLQSLLDRLPPGLAISLSPAVQAPNWAELARIRDTARDRRAEGLMLKRLSSPYFVGRKRGDWWKWKVDPFSIDAVMIYAQAGHGRRANLYTDFTFAVRDGADLVPFAKAYSGLTDAEFAEISRWVQKHTLERFGPVRRVPPELVFELAFEGIQESPRHKSGISLRFPRMIRWRRDKSVDDIDTLAGLRALLTAP